MTKIAPANTTVEVIPRRLELGPSLNVSSGGVAVSGNGEHVEVIAANAPVEVQTTVLRPDTAIQVGVKQVQVESSPVGLRGEQGPPGPPGPPGSGGGSSFLPIADEFDEADATYFYYGWADVDGGWLVRRGDRLTAKKVNATETENPGFATLADAWLKRTSLVYA